MMALQLPFIIKHNAHTCKHKTKRRFPRALSMVCPASSVSAQRFAQYPANRKAAHPEGCAAVILKQDYASFAGSTMDAEFSSRNSIQLACSRSLVAGTRLVTSSASRVFLIASALRAPGTMESTTRLVIIW